VERKGRVVVETAVLPAGRGGVRLWGLAWRGFVVAGCGRREGGGAHLGDRGLVMRRGGGHVNCVVFRRFRVWGTGGLGGGSCCCRRRALWAGDAG